jgi:uncharacterized protein (DUF362 family)
MSSPTAFSTPFASPDGRTTAVVASGADAYANARQALAHFDLGAARNRRVLLKPNAGRIVRAGLGITTDPRVVAAAIDAFVEAGADVSVGDSPIVGVKELQALESTGIADVARERGCRVLSMDKRRYVEVPLPEGRAIHALRVCPDVFEHDLIVSIPVMKTHMHTRVSLAIKNMKGCLWRRSKVDLHMLPPVPGHSDKSLDVAIADMSAALRPHLALIDGTVGMQGLGPSAGTQKPLGAVVASADAFAADAVACRLMGLAAEEVPHLRLGAEWGYGVIDLERIEVTPANWRDRASPFDRAPTSLAIEFSGVDVRDEKSCSACQSTLLLYLRRFGEKLVADFGNGHPVVVAIGKGHASVPEGTVCIGNCLLEHRARGVFVPGCPPVGSAIERTIDAARQGIASPAYAEEIETDDEDEEA